jgi:hypothetical protein|tara:strand:- start:13012 stop:13551 length:540 start_codon:yes stop_codon:yes gene_type:complete
MVDWPQLNDTKQISYNALKPSIRAFRAEFNGTSTTDGSYTVIGTHVFQAGEMQANDVVKVVAEAMSTRGGNDSFTLRIIIDDGTNTNNYDVSCGTTGTVNTTYFIEGKFGQNPNTTTNQYGFITYQHVDAAMAEVRGSNTCIANFLTKQLTVTVSIQNAFAGQNSFARVMVFKLRNYYN